MLFLVPFVFAVDLQPRGINDDQSTGLRRFAQEMAWQFNASFGDAAEVGNADVRAHHACHRDHEALGLTKRQMKHLTYQYGRLDGMIRVFLWSPTRASFGGAPVSDRILSKPDCEVTAPAQCIVVLGPIVHLVLGFGELVTAALAMFVRHGLFVNVKSNRIIPSHTLDAGFLNYSTTPR